MSENNLESFLLDLFEKECNFSIDAEEEEFIQTGVETLVKKLVEKILERLYKDEDSGSIKIENVKEELKRSGVIFRRCTKNDILRVGSSQEKTRNKFPDEFDFVFPVLCCEYETNITDSSARAISKFLSPTYVVSGVIAKQEEKKLEYPDREEPRKLLFDKSIGVAGPARKLQFIYWNDKEEKRYISVDLVAAATIKGDFADRCLNKDLKPFQDLLREIGRVLLVKEVITFTETETRFIKEKLTENHKTVYRLLKYLINGHDDTTFTFATTKRREYSSYILKNFIIHHHCNCVDCQGIAPCALSVLNEMCKHKDTAGIPMLTRTNAYNKPLKTRVLFLLPFLKNLTTKLKSIKDSSEKYDYGKIELKIMKSVSAKYKEYKEGKFKDPHLPDDFDVDDSEDDDVQTNYEN